MTEFVAHVKRQVLSTNTTRREAAEQLAALVFTTESVPDCVALGTKLKQLFSQMYPEGLSQEPEPTTKRLAVLSVHKLLQNLKLRRGKAALVRAWQDFTTYDGAELFQKYVDEKHHTPELTDAATTAYLGEVTSQLENAHRMFVQTSQQLPTPNTTSSYVASLQQVVQHTGVDSSVLTNFLTNHARTGTRPRHRQRPQMQVEGEVMALGAVPTGADAGAVMATRVVALWEQVEETLAVVVEQDEGHGRGGRAQRLKPARRATATIRWQGAGVSPTRETAHSARWSRVTPWGMRCAGPSSPGVKQAARDLVRAGSCALCLKGDGHLLQRLSAAVRVRRAGSSSRSLTRATRRRWRREQ